MDMTGSVEFWDSKPFIDAANILTAADEPLLALKVLDSVPSFYRDNIPTDILALKNKIRKHLATPVFYLQEKPSPRYADDNAVEDIPKLFASYVESLLRGQMILKDVRDINSEKLCPVIVDLGPGEYWLPIGLKHLGADFHYRGIGLCDSNRLGAAHFLSVNEMASEGRADIFVACELIEHLHCEQDIRTEFERNAPDAKIIHISTPLYTFDGRASQIDWEAKGGLGHLRTYSPTDFFAVVSRMFPEFKCALTVSQIMHIRGERA